jgi:hypothetical protein
MKRTMILFLMSSLILGLMACQINLPQIGGDPTDTPPAETQPTLALPTVTPPPTDAPTEMPTATALPPTPTTDPVLDILQLVLESRTRSEESATLPGYRMTSTYPVITAPVDARLTQFNNEVDAIVTGMENSFRTDASAIPNDPNFPGGQSFQQIDYDAVYFGRGIISINFKISWYMSGAAHPNSFSSVLNYDLLTGTSLVLSDLFVSGSDYLGDISAYCIQDLNDRGLLMFPEGANPTVENYKSWNITQSGLRITFDPYQVGPYAMGTQVVNVPYAELSSILRVDGAIGRVIAP